MSSSISTARPSTVRQPPTTILIVFLLGAAAALAGGFWDDAWHTERGRDSFFIAPHLAIYGGITAAGAALSAWALLALAAHGRNALRTQPALTLALLSITLTLASAPIDNAWHLAFGRDAVIWSPPHMLGIVGASGLAFAVLCALRAAGADPTDPRCTIAAGLVLAAASFVVVEYETDVPQFAVRWYLPALSTAAAIAFVLLRQAATGRWTSTRAAVAHLAFLVLVSAMLRILGFHAPLLPLLLLPAIVFDVVAERGIAWPVRALAHTVAIVATYAPLRAWQDDGLRMSGTDLLLGVVVASTGALSVFALAEGHRPTIRRSTSVLAVAVLLGAAAVSLQAPVPALAHDPGQGEPAGTVDLRAQSRGRTVTVSGRFAAPCPGLRAGDLLARRGGITRRAPLHRRGCTLSGAVTLSTGGQWFVYLTGARARTPIESWIPVPAGSGTRRLHDSARFVYVPNRRSAGTLKLVGGIVLYALAALLLAAMFSLSGRPAPRAPNTP